MLGLGPGPRVPPLQLPSSRESPLKPTRTSRRLQTPVKSIASTRRPLLGTCEIVVTFFLFPCAAEREYVV
jgi:hypothetical protein